MAEEALQAARAAVDVCFSGGGYLFSLKIDSPWLAAGIAIGTFYLANRALTERAIKNSLQGDETCSGNADPEVTGISTGSILVQLTCYTVDSLKRFTDDINSEKAKYRLEEELAKVGFSEKIRLTVEKFEVVSDEGCLLMGHTDLISRTAEHEEHGKHWSEINSLKMTVKMADTHRERRTYKVCIFNCDGICNLDEVTSLLKAVEEKADIEIKVQKYLYELNKTTIVEAEIRSRLEMDIAVLMVDARDNCPSFDDNRYGRIYKALKDKTGSDEKVLIVIGGDEDYKSRQEEEEEFISRSGRMKIGKGDLKTEVLDGRKSFMFSWNQNHRPIHEEAMMHFLDPCKRGQKFVRQVTPNVPSNQTQGDYLIPVDNEDETQGNESERYELVDVTDSTSTQEFTELSRTTHPKGTVLLSTIMQNGAISYRSEDVTVWKDDRRWRLSDNEERRLRKDWRLISTARLKLVADDEGKVQVRVEVETTFFQRVWHALSSRFRRR